MAGVEMVGAIDQWGTATATYADNFPVAARNVVTTALTDMSGAEMFPSIGRVDLLIASPECTNHSLARGSRPKCVESQRSGWYINRLLEQLEPQYIVLENVAMMRHWEGFGDLLKHLETRFGYRLRAQVLDAADFGVPQNRKRLFIFGAKSALPREVVLPRLRPATAGSILDPQGAWTAGPLENGRRGGGHTQTRSQGD